jgi:hypothetical protein
MHDVSHIGSARKVTGRQLLKLLRKYPDNAIWKAYLAFLIKVGFISIVSDSLTNDQACALTGGCLSYLNLIDHLTGDELNAALDGTASISDLQLKRRMQNGHGDKVLSMIDEQTLFAHLDARTAPQS